ncbi:MAG: DNA repair protein RecO [Coriobacteriia bacterium]|nr:DNA repair protein RecO [Coriobacteriia bacterium]
MATYPLTAMVLNKTKLGETDLILTLLGSDGARHKAIAKGARKPGSKFGGRSEPATVIQALLAKGKTLDIITDARTLKSHQELREDYDAAYALGVILDFAATVSQESLEEKRFFQLTDVALNTLEDILKKEECDADRIMRIKLLVIAYLLKAAAMHGYRFDGYAHAHEGFESRPIDSKVRHSLAFLLGATFDQLVEIDLDTFGQIDVLLDTTRLFLLNNIPARLKALDNYSRI